MFVGVKSKSSIMETLVNEAAISLDIDISRISFMKNDIFIDLLKERCKDEGEIASIMLMSVINYTENPVGVYEDGSM